MPGQGLNRNDLGSSSLPILAFLQGVGFPFTGALVDGETVGSFCAMLTRTITSANTDTTLHHALGRKPTGYHVYRRSAGGVIFDGSNNGTDWTDRTIVLRSTVAGNIVSILVF